MDDRVFKTRLFNDCPHAPHTPGVCKRSTDSLPYQWPLDSENLTSTFTSLQLMQFIIHKSNGDFDTFLDYLALSVEDLPALTRSEEFADAEYLNKATKKSLEQKVRKFRSSVFDGEHLFINGYPFQVSSLRQGTNKLFECLSALSSASMHLSTLASEMGLSPPPPLALTSTSTHKNRIRVNMPLSDMVPNSLVWFNDLLKDSRYKKWSQLNIHDDDTVEDFVSKVRKAEERNIPEGLAHTKLIKSRSHHLNLLIFVDPGDTDQFSYLSIPESVVQANLPIHVGAVLVPNGRVSKLIFASFHYFLRVKGKKTAVQFLGLIRQVLEYFGGAYRTMTISDKMVDIAFEQVSSKLANSKYKSPADVLQQDEEIGQLIDEASRFAEDMKLLSDMDEEELGPDADPDTKKFSKLCILNGIVIKDVSRDVIPLALDEQRRVAELLRLNKINIAKAENVTNEQWITSDPNVIVVNRLGRTMKTGDQRDALFSRDDSLPTMQAVELYALKEELRSISYLNGGTTEEKQSVTVWLASKHQDDTEHLKRLESYVQELSKSDFASRTKARFAIIPDSNKLHPAILQDSDPSTSRESTVLVINGRRFGASSLEGVHDLMVEIGMEFQQQSIPDMLEGELRLFYALYSREVGQAFSSMRNDAHGQKDINLEKILDAVEVSESSSMRFRSAEPSSESQKPITVTAVVNPLDSEGLLSISTVRTIRKAFGDDVLLDVILMPYGEGLLLKRELPKTFYKFLMSPTHPLDEENDAASLASSVSFRRVPQDSVLTVAVEPPRAWFVGSYSTNYDMDNVILNSLPETTGDMYSEYQLRNLIVEGSCIDEMEAPPQGLKLIIENDSGTSADTLVMANLGYFQLKVPLPGKWWLSLAPGPSTMIFSLKSMYMFLENKKFVYDADESGRIAIPVDSLSGAGGIVLRVAKKPGMEKKSVLDPEMAKAAAAKSQGGNMIGKLKSTFSKLYSGKTKEDGVAGATGTQGEREVINVFSVASGHLYERFLKIMISSVTKHASRPVKFWLLENYLSPPFKKALPAFAKKFGAEVAMVTYRWPLWLRAQTEKQRIIWAYKILFLDVLFPLDLGRIIFVDSDQVIRGDLAELMDIDMKGAPYGYVPFCESRKEVEGYRFWKQGFWKQTLGDAKYRISALYVVDLNRFRETAAGDNLRMIYQSLSADPNSLSNLDQDLPNYASANTGGGGPVVPIFDLPQEWLWCESWCDDESKKLAKAIDLCNNPMTKEPKLQSARRIISEWTKYDDEASDISEDIYAQLMEVGPTTIASSGEAKEEL